MNEREPIKLIADGSTADKRPNSSWRGFGYISANNSSRLLLDYRAEHREVYDRLLTYMFDKELAAVFDDEDSYRRSVCTVCSRCLAPLICDLYQCSNLIFDRRA